MPRIVTALLALIGVLALSTPGGACFLWQGFGVDHHHHASGVEEHSTTCFHEHEHEHGHESHPDGGQPELPCNPETEESLIALAAVAKVAPDAAPASAEFTPAWLIGSEFGPGAPSGSAIRHGPPPDERSGAPPPRAALLCRFLI